MDGKALAKEARTHISNCIDGLRSSNAHITPKLVIIQVGSRRDSTSYVNMKQRAANEARIECEIHRLPGNATEQEVLRLIYDANEDYKVHGILVQLPLPSHLNEHTITEAVADSKDVDGFGVKNIGELSSRNGKPLFLPCTPKGILYMLKANNVRMAGAHAVVLGRSNVVGGPMANLLRHEDATVTVLHSKSQNIPQIVATADIIVAAIGKPDFVKGDWVKQGAVVIDVGMNYVDDDESPKGYVIKGDVEFDSVAPRASLITPVPGGVGPMTVAMLLDNVFLAAERFGLEEVRSHVVKPLPINPTKPTPSDIEVSRSQSPKKVSDLAKEIGLLPSEIEPYGNFKGKIRSSVLDRLHNKPNGKYILVTGITPTPLGEGKSTTTMGLAQAIGAHLNKSCIACVRQPSMGPTFGIKGGAAGGGYAQVIPMEEFNLHLTGDIHAIGAATNLLAAAIDARMFHEATQKDVHLYKRLVPTKKGVRKFTPTMLKRLRKLGIDKTEPDELTDEEIHRFARLNIDPDSITWKRVVDCNDRMLRKITIGQAPTERGFIRETGFEITVASEIMAILTLSKSIQDMRERLGKIVVANTCLGEPVTCDDIGCGGALAVLLKDAINPNIMQTLEGTPVFVHCGPFANISIGANSIIADQIALKLTGAETEEDIGYVVTEAGFDFTMGGERFLNIKSRTSGLIPDVVIIVATVRALKSHGGGPPVAPGAPVPDAYTHENLDFVRNGCANLVKHIENATSYGLPVVVAINQMTTDTAAEHQVIYEEALKGGAVDAVVANHWAEGGKGAVDLAKSVMKAASLPKNFRFLYDSENLSLEAKLNAIAQKMYGASHVELSPLAQSKIDIYTKQGFGDLPICIAKTQYSLSHDPALKGRPKNFVMPIRDVKISVGAGYLYALAAEIMTIPGLPTHPGYMNVELADDGTIEGMF